MKKLLKEFIQENKEFEFDEKFYFESIKSKRSLETTWRDFTKKIAYSPSENELIKPHLTLLRKHPIYKNKRVLTSKDTLRKDQHSYMTHLQQDLWQWTTSGTSGLPLTVYYDQKTYLKSLYLTVPKSCYIRGINLDTKNLLFSIYVSDNPIYKKTVFLNPLKEFGLQAFFPLQTNVLSDFEKLISFLQKNPFQVMCIKPQLLKSLIQYCKKYKKFITFKAVIVSGSKLTSKLRLEANFISENIMSSYNTSELNFITAECRYDFHHIDVSELIPALKENQTSGELIFSALKNSAMPLWKYKTGDKGVLKYKKCRCGKHGYILKKIEGKIAVLFKMPSGKWFSPTTWMDIYKKFPELKEFQVIQTSINTFEVFYENQSNKKINKHFLKNYILNSLEENCVVTIIKKDFDENEKFSRFVRRI